jgi:hypothetical protein
MHSLRSRMSYLHYWFPNFESLKLESNKKQQSSFPILFHSICTRMLHISVGNQTPIHNIKDSTARTWQLWKNEQPPKTHLLRKILLFLCQCLSQYLILWKSPHCLEESFNLNVPQTDKLSTGDFYFYVWYFIRQYRGLFYFLF